MKIMQLTTFLLSILFLNIHSMQIPVEQQLLNGNISAADYLLYMEGNPTIWGVYAQEVLELHIADYSGHFENLYDILVDDVDTIVQFNQNKLASGQCSLQKCIKNLITSIKKAIGINYKFLLQGIADGEIT